jgi:hypothetical protein
MEPDLLFANLTNPTLLFFVLGVIATAVKSDLQIPAATSKFISLYLLFSIGFKGGQELQHSPMNAEIGLTLGLAVLFAATTPILAFFILRRKLGVANASAVAAAYGSVSAVTFVAATSFLEGQKIPFGGHMVACMALMESPAIIIGVLLMRHFTRAEEGGKSKSGLRGILHESLTNGSVIMVVGALVIGILADSKQAEGIKPFTTDIFKGFLAIFLLEMGMVAARGFRAFLRYGWVATLFALLAPPVNGLLAIWISATLGLESGNQFLLAILAASASYIAVPAAMRQVVPEADPGLYIPMALGVTFPFNISLGLPMFWMLIENI